MDFAHQNVADSFHIPGLEWLLRALASCLGEGRKEGIVPKEGPVCCGGVVSCFRSQRGAGGVPVTPSRLPQGFGALVCFVPGA